MVVVVTVIVGLPVAAILIAVATILVFDRTNGHVVSSDEQRELLLYVPSTYDPDQPTPLIISLHAGATWPAQQKNLSGWNRLADRHGFIVVYPSGTPQFLGVARIWHTFALDSGVEQDVAFIADLIDALRSDYNIDRARIYANGMSNGAGMAFVLACTLSDRIAAAGLVAPAQSLPPDWCAATRPVPIIAFHGTDDPIVPYEGGPLGDPLNPVKPIFPSILDFVASWSTRNGCGPNPTKAIVAADVTRLSYSACADGADVVLNTISGGGHSWPGGKPMPSWRVGPTSNSIDATTEMWAFFRAHPLIVKSSVAAQPPLP